MNRSTPGTGPNDFAAAQDHADTIRRAIYANGPQEWKVPIGALNALLAEREQFRAAAEGLLDVGERSRSGDPSLDPEEWYAIRDYARKVLNDAG